MYAVVGCGECQALWIVEGRPDSSECPRCGTRRPFAKRRKFVETEDQDHAREVRSSMLANRSGHGEAFAELDSFADMDERVDEAGIDDATYLESSGLDADEVEAAGDRAGGSGGETGSKSRREIVQAAVRELDEPTAEEIVNAAAADGVPEAYTRKALEKLVRAGEVSETGGVYRSI